GYIWVAALQGSAEAVRWVVPFPATLSEVIKANSPLRPIPFGRVRDLVHDVVLGVLYFNGLAIVAKSAGPIADHVENRWIANPEGVGIMGDHHVCAGRKRHIANGEGNAFVEMPAIQADVRATSIIEFNEFFPERF